MSWWQVAASSTQASRRRDNSSSFSSIAVPRSAFLLLESPTCINVACLCNPPHTNLERQCSADRKVPRRVSRGCGVLDHDL